jgi:chaperone modulatory protein CbpM
MSVLFTKSQVLSLVPGLSRTRLTAFINADLVVPPSTVAGTMFRPIDLARLELLCDLADQFDLEGDALAVVMSLLDQLHHARNDLRAIAQAMQAEPQDLRARVAARLVGVLTP